MTLLLGQSRKSEKSKFHHNVEMHRDKSNPLPHIVLVERPIPLTTEYLSRGR